MQSKHTWQQGMIKWVGGHMLLCCWCGRLVGFLFFLFFFERFSSWTKENPRRWSNSWTKETQKMFNHLYTKEGRGHGRRCKGLMMIRRRLVWRAQKEFWGKQVWQGMQKEKENVQPTFINYYYYYEFLFSLKKMWMGSAPASSHIDDTVKKKKKQRRKKKREGN